MPAVSAADRVLGRSTHRAKCTRLPAVVCGQGDWQACFVSLASVRAVLRQFDTFEPRDMRMRMALIEELLSLASIVVSKGMWKALGG